MKYWVSLCFSHHIASYIHDHYNDIIMSAMAPPITSLTIVCSTVYSDQKEHQSSTSMAFVRGIHRWPVNSSHKKASNAENVSIWWRHHVLTPRRIFQCDITVVIVYITQHPILAVALLDKFGSRIYSYTDFLYFCFVYTEYIKIDYMQDIIRIVTSSNGNISHFIGPLCGEFTGHQWIPSTKASDAELWCFLWSAPEQTVE